MALRVFISYAKSDQDLAEDLRARLEQVADDVIQVAPKMKQEKAWSAALLSQLKKAHLILVLFTPNSLDSPNVQLIIGAGVALQKQIVPIVVGLDEAALPVWVRRMHFVRYPELSTYLLDLAREAGKETAAVHRASAMAGVAL
jgi:hypothetical protein